MKGKYVKEFIKFPDILATGVLFLVTLLLTIPCLQHAATWIALVLGMISYAASEYVIHRYLFHMKPPKSPFLLKLIKRLHYDHHVVPNELHLLFLPVWYSFPFIGIASALAFWITASWALTVNYAAGITGYLLFYEWTHYVAHRPIQPRLPGAGG